MQKIEMTVASTVLDLQGDKLPLEALQQMAEFANTALIRLLSSMILESHLLGDSRELTYANEMTANSNWWPAESYSHRMMMLT